MLASLWPLLLHLLSFFAALRPGVPALAVPSPAPAIQCPDEK